jgi:hypothetical protein
MRWPRRPFPSAFARAHQRDFSNLQLRPILFLSILAFHVVNFSLVCSLFRQIGNRAVQAMLAEAHQLRETVNKKIDEKNDERKKSYV